MKNRHLTLITLCAVCIVAMVVGIVIPANGVTGEKFLSDARQSYRSSSLVISATCEDTFTDADGYTVSRVRVNEVLAGNAKQGALLHVQDELNAGGEYLMYLADGKTVHFAEDQHTYVPVSTEPFVISGDTVEYGGSSMLLDDIKLDMIELNKTVTVHGGIYYYNDLDALKEASESIFIGKVLSVSSMKNTRFRSQQGGSTIEKTAPAATVTVMVYGSVKGAVGYGSTIQLMYVPESAGSMTDGATLEPVLKDKNDILSLDTDSTYLFFLTDDPDAKQDKVFPVNPIQGWVKVENDMLISSAGNTALAGYETLPQLIADMRK